MNVKNRTDVKDVGGDASPSYEQSENGVMKEDGSGQTIGAQILASPILARLYPDKVYALLIILSIFTIFKTYYIGDESAKE